MTLDALRRIWLIMNREMRILWKNPIYGFCMVIFPIAVLIFFTTMLDEGVPEELPVGVVDADNTSTSRALVRRLDAFQSSRIVASYPTAAEARHAMQRNEIYAFLYIPKATLRARGATDEQVMSFLQPITIDLHQIANPWSNYNVYLSTVFVPGIVMLFIFLITAYSIGVELKFKRSKEWVGMADGNMLVAMLGKFLPQSLIWLAIFFGYEYYIYGVLHFPHEGGAWPIIFLGFLAVFASQGFGIFAFGLMPSLRMSMSVCSLWAVLSLSMAGSAFPIMGMDAPLQSLSWLFPLRHYYMVYQITVFNGFPFLEAWFHLVALVFFTLLPWTVIRKIKNAMLNYVYIP